MESQILFSVIIVNYNSLDYIKGCLFSIDKYNDLGKNLEIIIVDNSNQPNDYEWLINNTPYKIIKNDNKGFGQANNVGARVAKGKYLLFLNPDTCLIEPIFQKAISIFSSNNKIGLFGCQLLSRDLKKNYSFGLRLSLGFCRTVLSKILSNLGVFIPKLMFTSGAAIFIRSELFMKIGMFDENIFMYCEESDIANRINNVGYLNKCCKDIHIIHLEGKCTKTKSETTYFKMIDSKLYYCKKYDLNYKILLKKEKKYCMFKSLFYKIIGCSKLAENYRIFAKGIKKRYLSEQ